MLALTCSNGRRSKTQTCSGFGWRSVFVICCLVAGSSHVWADEWPNFSSLPPDTEFNVTYEIGNEASTLQRVKLGNVVVIEAREFLVVYISGSQTPAYVDFESVRSIVPSPEVVPGTQ